MDISNRRTRRCSLRMPRSKPIARVGGRRLDEHVVFGIRAGISATRHAIAANANPTQSPMARFNPDRKPLFKSELPFHSAHLCCLPLRRVLVRRPAREPKRLTAVQSDGVSLIASVQLHGPSVPCLLTGHTRHAWSRLEERSPADQPRQQRGRAKACLVQDGDIHGSGRLLGWGGCQQVVPQRP